MRRCQILVLRDDQHGAGEEVLRVVRVMRDEASLHVITLADIHELASGKVRVRPRQEIDPGATGLLASDEIRQGRTRGDRGANREHTEFGRDNPDDVPSTR
jgi:hypothetical protein